MVPKVNAKSMFGWLRVGGWGDRAIKLLNALLRHVCTFSISKHTGFTLFKAFTVKTSIPVRFPFQNVQDSLF